jgi:hypothetical protein
MDTDTNASAAKEMSNAAGELEAAKRYRQRASEREVKTGRCVRCSKGIQFGTDGACRNCGAEICLDCWTIAGHECPKCKNFDGRITATQKEGR